MVSLAAAAPASLGVSEMLGSPLKFAGSSRSAPAPSGGAATKVVALFSKKKIFLPEGLLDRSEVPAYLNGELRVRSFGLSKKPEDFAKYQAYELIHARWAMLGAAGFIIPEAFNKFGANCGPEAVWFKTGALLLDGNTLNYFGKNIPSTSSSPFAAEIVLDLEDKLHPGGPFDPLGLANDPDQAALLKVKEIKNGRLAMFAMLGFFLQAYHLSDPFGNNLLTVISGSAERVPTL
ncbi:unnamed protein product [Spirodela intermedia]|uniref:Chlorophyll a-b binding protein, chloroplastic n=1 Tax=Spirodela intermedia TaxID=51605 RepID=A0A7I8ITE9_SPIIN|nr:unnamed protein product [Spirodela intermedia]CAA6660234.1 unnamed protein product [Spirodela intermedia]